MRSVLSAIFAALVAAGGAVAEEKSASGVTLPDEDWRQADPYRPAADAATTSPGVRVPDGPTFYADRERGLLKVIHELPGAQPRTVKVPLRNVECVALSTDGKILYVGSRTDWGVWAFPIQRDGMPHRGKRFALLSLPAGADRLAVTALTTDTDGHVYAATSEGIQVFAKDGRPVEVLKPPAGGEVSGLSWTGDRRNRLTAQVEGEPRKFTRRLNATGPK